MSEVFALYFSPTGNTMAVARAIAKGVAKVVSGNDYFGIDITSVDSRRSVYDFGPDDIVILAMPTYAGRIPNKIAPYIEASIYGDNAIAIPVVTYGNRSFDDSLKELATIMSENGMSLCGAAAVPSQHAFSEKIATQRPNEEDLKALEAYGESLGHEIIKGNFDRVKLSEVPGRDMDDSAYYVPLKEDGTAASFLKAYPVTDDTKCEQCGECRYACPMDCFKDSITEPEGVCIKCMACVEVCPNKAKTFVDEEYLSHVKMLEANYAKVSNNILTM